MKNMKHHSYEIFFYEYSVEGLNILINLYLSTKCKEVQSYYNILCTNIVFE